jgi:DNA-binding winged helix-turn-helix (wHTH) protein
MDTPLEIARPDLHDFRVGTWLVQPGLNLLVTGEKSIRVRPQLIDVLACLAVRPGSVVTRDQLLNTVWSDRFVCPSGIARCVAELRRILGDDARRPRIIETIPKRGYRLIASVQHAGAGATQTADMGSGIASGEFDEDEQAARQPSSDHVVRHGLLARALLSTAAGLFAVWRNPHARAAQ